MRRLILALAFALAVLIAIGPKPGHAADSSYSPEVEQAAHEVGESLRCVVCQNQSIEDSGAPLAADMRHMVRERLAAGQSKQEVIDYMAGRYGNFVLLKPPFQIDTLFLWLGPLGFAALALFGWFTYLRPRARGNLAPSPLSPEEEKRLAQRLAEDMRP